jgi:quercetin dioxygenase-like cupin family protein
MMVLVKFEKGGIGNPHNHQHSQSTYVESGEFEVLMGDKTQILKKGDCFFAPPSVKHGVVCKKEGVLVDVFSPIREDFL